MRGIESVLGSSFCPLQRVRTRRSGVISKMDASDKADGEASSAKSAEASDEPRKSLFCVELATLSPANAMFDDDDEGPREEEAFCEVPRVPEAAFSLRSKSWECEGA